MFALALLTKPDYALLIGVVLSLVLFLWKTMHPRIVRITKDPELNMFVNADVCQKPSCPQILELRPDNCIFFGNAEYTMEQMLSRLDEQKTRIKFLLLDFESIAFIDISGVEELFGLLDELKKRDIEMAFLYVHLPVKKVLESTNFLYVVGRGPDAGKNERRHCLRFRAAGSWLLPQCLPLQALPRMLDSEVRGKEVSKSGLTHPKRNPSLQFPD